MQTLKIKVHPNKSKTKKRDSVSREDIDMEVDLKARAENNEANVELIRFLSKELGVGRDNVEIVGGFKSRIKVVRII